MAVIEYFLAGGLALIVQAIFTLKTGDIRPLGFLMRPPSSAFKSKRLNRMVGGLFFLACGLWVLHVPFVANLRGVPLANWLTGRLGPLSAVAFCGGLGAFLLAWPAAFIGWLRSTYPQIPATARWALMIPRGVGVAALVIAVQTLAGLLYGG